MAYETISDPANPFNKTGLSLEARALLGYVEDAKRDMAAAFVVTCTTDHDLKTASGNYSRHRQEGTEGEGLAIDGRMRTRGTTPKLHLPWFNAFAKVESQLQELIYAYAPYNIKAGKRVAPYAVASHKDHVHVAVNKGVFLRYPNAVIVPSREVPPPQTAVYAFANTMNGVHVRSFPVRIPTDAEGDGHAPACPAEKFISATPFGGHDKYAGDAASTVTPVNGRDNGGTMFVTVASGPPNAEVYAWVTAAD